jgi:hypothetical protein
MSRAARPRAIDVRPAIDVPRVGLWADLAGAYSGRPASPAELDRLLDSASAYLLESACAEGGPVVSLFHQALVEHVRSLATPERVEAAFTDVLTRRAAQTGGWLSAQTWRIPWARWNLGADHIVTDAHRPPRPGDDRDPRDLAPGVGFSVHKPVDGLCITAVALCVHRGMLWIQVQGSL